jgi:hypothetical protein
MSGNGNKPNCCYWAPNNPHKLHHDPLHNAKAIVWCAISSHGITGPNFCDNEEGCTVTVNAQQYKVMLETFLRMSYVHVSSICYGSHQERVIAPTAWTYRQVLRTMFPEDSLVSGTSFGPAHSSEPAVPDYFFWGYTKHILPIMMV